MKYIGPAEASARIFRAHAIQPSELDRPMVRREFDIRTFKWRIQPVVQSGMIF
jgi:hypothetical protein